MPYLIDDHKFSGIHYRGLLVILKDLKWPWSAQDGKKAVQHLQQDATVPHIVLLDIVMPGMNGVEVAKWIFENKKEIKVLALTMEEDDNSVIQMLQYGVKGYLLKMLVQRNYIWP